MHIKTQKRRLLEIDAQPLKGSHGTTNESRIPRGGMREGIREVSAVYSLLRSGGGTEPDGARDEHHNRLASARPASWRFAQRVGEIERVHSFARREKAPPRSSPTCSAHTDVNATCSVHGTPKFVIIRSRQHLFGRMARVIQSSITACGGDEWNLAARVWSLGDARALQCCVQKIESATTARRGHRL